MKKMNSIVFCVVILCASAAVASAGPLIHTFGMPIRASCKLDWTFNKACSDIQASLVAQISKWNNDSNCPNHDNEKCLYSLTNSDVSNGVLQATHMTPVKRYVDTLDLKLVNTAAGVCGVHAESRSNTWYAVLDYSTNYCNLHNLVTGAALDQVPGYSEVTSNNQCTQYSTANCEKY